MSSIFMSAGEVSSKINKLMNKKREEARQKKEEVYIDFQQRLNKSWWRQLLGLTPYTIDQAKKIFHRNLYADLHIYTIDLILQKQLDKLNEIEEIADKLCMQYRYSEGILINSKTALELLNLD